MGRSTGFLTAIAMGILFTGPGAFAQTKPDTAWRKSPNYTARPSRTIRYVIIHTIEGTYQGAISWFANPNSRVSAHYVVSRNGDVTQTVRDNDIAWHAGNWTYNSQSIGIEHEGYAGRADTWDHDAMLRTSAQLTAWLCKTYDIPVDRDHIIGHKEVPNQSHWDPGPHFPWDYYIKLVEEYTNGSTPQPEPEPEPEPEPQPRPEVVEVTVSYLNVRAGIWGTKLGVVRGGQKFVAIERSNGWVKIYFGGRTAWMYAGYTRTVRAPVTTVTAGALNIRTGPGVGHSRIGTLSQGQQYVRHASAGDWVELQFDARSGWSYKPYTSTRW